MQEIIINHQPVELFKILKFQGLVESGAEAKAVIAEGLVMLNGAVETQKRKKIIAGDQIFFNGQQFVTVLL